MLGANQRHWSELLRPERTLDAPTTVLPNLSPLLTRAGWARSGNAAQGRYSDPWRSPDLRGVGSHLPNRSAAEAQLWECRRCQAPWPCPVARQRLLARYGRTPALGRLCHDLLEQAVREGLDLPVPQLFIRFIEWTLPPR
ncbi:hypothetical protein JQS43_02520 [Natronosporangium hydrolyticum]|uniref:Uncharacterized protein n=1 Tax=Natronosporangium hydrolyticum TaxID=2811111 RepID=A0A895YMW2_9ACTN|nr:hypothetical protein [Natronosporangium hydrolyticum]QSB15258.1 hypothetical protein JQS43_02520 [Natronosporangium hydrolyticum]